MMSDKKFIHFALSARIFNIFPDEDIPYSPPSFLPILIDEYQKLSWGGRPAAALAAAGEGAQSCLYSRTMSLLPKF